MLPCPAGLEIWPDQRNEEIKKEQRKYRNAGIQWAEPSVGAAPATQQLKLSTFTHSCAAQREELTVSVGGLWMGAVSGCAQLGRRRKLQLLGFAHAAHIPTYGRRKLCQFQVWPVRGRLWLPMDLRYSVLDTTVPMSTVCAHPGLGLLFTPLLRASSAPHRRPCPFGRTVIHS